MNAGAAEPTCTSALHNGTTITVSWTPPNTGATPTGYVIYYQATGDQGSVTVYSGSATWQEITGQQENQYNITIVALSSKLPSKPTTVRVLRITTGKSDTSHFMFILPFHTLHRIYSCSC